MPHGGRAVVACLALLSAAGCGGGSAPPAGDASPAIAPSGGSGHVVHYHCVAGRRDTIVVKLADPRLLAQVLNPINVCEYDGGLADVSLLVDCASGAPAREVRIAAVHGQLPPSTAQAICG